MFDLLIKNCTIVDGRQEPFIGSTAVRGEKIAAILTPEPDVEARMVIDGTGQVLFPGVIDPHVHFHYKFNYRDNDKDYDTETYSALLGGVTTAIRMHRGATAIGEHLPQEIEKLQQDTRMDMAMHLTLSTENDLATFRPFCDEYGINSFKLYNAYKGKAGKLQGILGSDDGFLYQAMECIGKYPNGVACIHAENTEIIETIADKFKAENRKDFAAWPESRPGWTEGEAIYRSGIIAYHAKCPLYVVHISAAEGIAAIEQLRQLGIQVYAEVCIQHLTHTMDTPLGSVAKVNPPLRYQRDVDALWDAIRRGVVDTVATDHVAHTRAKANVPVWDVMPGNPGTGTMLPALLHFGYHQGRLSISQVASLLSANAAKIFHLAQKGKIAVDADADLTLVDLDKDKTVTPAWLGSSSDYSLYEGMTLRGWPTKTILRGKVVMSDGEVRADLGYGRFIRRY